MRNFALIAGLILGLSTEAFAQKKKLGSVVDKSEDAAGRTNEKEKSQQAGSGFDGNKGLSTADPHLNSRTPELNQGFPDMIGERQIRGNTRVFPQGTDCQHPPIPEADISPKFLLNAKKVPSTQGLSQNASYYQKLIDLCSRKEEILSKNCKPGFKDDAYETACESDKKYVRSRCQNFEANRKEHEGIMKACRYEVKRREWMQVAANTCSQEGR